MDKMEFEYKMDFESKMKCVSEIAFIAKLEIEPNWYLGMYYNWPLKIQNKCTVRKYTTKLGKKIRLKSI